MSKDATENRDDSAKNNDDNLKDVWTYFIFLFFTLFIIKNGDARMMLYKIEKERAFYCFNMVSMTKRR